MQLRFRLFSLLVIGSVVALLPLPTRGDIVTQVQGLPISAPAFTTSPSFAFTNWDYTAPSALIPYGAFDKFHDDPKFLTQVAVKFTWGIESDFTLKFTTPTTTTLTVTVSDIVANLHLPDGTTLTSGPQTLSFSDTKSSPQTETTSKFLVAQSPIVKTYFTPADLALFAGAGKLFLPIDASAVSNFTTSSGNGLGLAQTQVGVVVELDFTVTPEPSSCLLVLIGAAGLATVPAFRRRLAGLATD